MCPDCKQVDSQIADDQSSRLFHHCRDLGKWILPSVVLALMPKCPVCVAAYVAIASGIGISISTATLLRSGLILVCTASLVYLVAMRIQRLLVSSLVK